MRVLGRAYPGGWAADGHASVKRFKRQIRRSYVSFLAFTHRYWFHEVSVQAHVTALFHLCTRHLQTDSVYDEVKERIRDMNSYLDADSLRRRANTVVRLTVALTLYTIAKSKRLSDFLDVVSDERVSCWAKLKSFVAIWTTPG